MIFLYLFLFSQAYIFLASLATGDYEVSYAGTDINELRERALWFYDVAHYNTKGVVFPDLRFNCSGSITSVWFVASEDESGVIYPEFQLWTRGSISTGIGLSSYQGIVKDSRSPPISRVGLHVHVNGSDVALYEYRLEDTMPFETDDILGIWLRHSLLKVNHLKGGGVRNYLFRSRRIYTYSPTSEWEPLLALEVSDESCLDGFLNVETLQQYMEMWSSYDYSYEDDAPQSDDYSYEDATPQDDDYYDNDAPHDNNTMGIPSNQLSYVFPYLQFFENGLLEKWLFAAKLVPPLSNPISIEFQVWRREGTRHASITTTNVTSPAKTGYINVYEHTVHPPLPVIAGDCIGVAVQSPSYLWPQWVPGSGELYQRIPQGADSVGLIFFGRAIPLFAAQIQVTAQPSHASSASTDGITDTSVRISQYLHATTIPSATSGMSSATISDTKYMSSSTTSASDAATATTVSSAPPDVISSVSPGITDVSTDTGSQSSVGAGVGVGVGAAVMLQVVVGVLGVGLFCVWRRRNPSKVVLPVSLTNDHLDNSVYKSVSGHSNTAATDNVAYGISNMEMSGNVAYSAINSANFKSESIYDYTSTTDGNDIIITSPNEAYAATGNVPVSSNLAYGIVHY